MRVALKTAVLIFAALLTFLVTAADLNKDKLDQYLNTLAKNDKAMVSVAISKNGKTVYEHAVGFSDINSKNAATFDTKYRIGSISKTYTATMIMQLVEKGVLKLNDPLSKYFPSVANAKDITIQHLLENRSGIKSFTDEPNAQERLYKTQTRQEMLEWIAGYDSQFEPGSKHQYSNSNYFLLGMLIEKLTGKNYAEVLQETIVKPLKLQSTYFGKPVNNGENVAHSYIYQAGTWQQMPDSDMSGVHGAGAIVSTATELTQFMDALFNAKLVSEKSLDSMMDLKEGYGKGMFRVPFGSLFAYGHNGRIDGFNSHAGYFPENGVSFAVLSNGLNYSFNDILIGVLSIYYNIDFKIPDFSAKVIQLSEEVLSNYQGEFTSSTLPLDIKVMVKQGKMYAQATGQGAFPLEALSKFKFKFDPAGIVIKFAKNSVGKVDYDNFVLNQAGLSHSFTRK